ncbi:MAG: hypothetical protein ABI950_10175 [Solirubrobacteraceae bacterium]
MRILLVGGGRPGLELMRGLAAEGHAVRFVTRNEGFRADIEAAGGECWIGTPDVVGSLRYALENVTILMWLLGGVEEDPLHGSRLRMMLEKTTDTTVRGVVYEVGTPAGVAEMEHAWATNEIPFALLEADREDPATWVRATRAAIDDVLAVRR